MRDGTSKSASAQHPRPGLKERQATQAARGGTSLFTKNLNGTRTTPDPMHHTHEVGPIGKHHIALPSPPSPQRLAVLKHKLLEPLQCLNAPPLVARRDLRVQLEVLRVAGRRFLMMLLADGAAAQNSLIGPTSLLRSLGFDGFDAASHKRAELIHGEVLKTRRLVEGQLDALGHVAIAAKVGLGAFDDDGAAQLLGRRVHAGPVAPRQPNAV